MSFVSCDCYDNPSLPCCPAGLDADGFPVPRKAPTPVFRRRGRSTTDGAVSSDAEGNGGATPARSRRSSGASIGAQSRSSSRTGTSRKPPVPRASDTPVWIKRGSRDAGDALEAVTSAILGHTIADERGERAGARSSFPEPPSTRPEGSFGRSSAPGTPSSVGRRKPEWKVAMKAAPDMFKLTSTGKEPVRGLVLVNCGCKEHKITHGVHRRAGILLSPG